MSAGFDKKIIIIAAVAVAISGVLISAFSGIGQSVDDTDQTSFAAIESTQKRAAIINMLHSDLPNPNFEETSMKLLKNAGYQVDLYRTDEATIELYKQLPKLNYDIILFRTHGLPEGNIEASASIFSGEIYKVENYKEDQWFARVGKAVPITYQELGLRDGWEGLGNRTYFTIGSKFVQESMDGKFSDTTILIAGCDALSGTLLANAFVSKGASIVIGWDGLISSSDNDKGILLVLEEIVNGTTPEYVPKKVMEQISVNPEYPAELRMYTSRF